MSLDEDNNPFSAPTGEDEFTDLPLSQDEQHTEPEWADETPVITNDDHSGEEDAPAPVTHQTSSQTAVASGTQAYDPEMYTSTTQHAFKDKSAVNLEITDAGKSREGNTRGYIVYTIKCNDKIVRRRYSEFETLRKSLLKLFPIIIIPPIPEKHKMTNYATAPTTAKEDSTIIDHRRRMLAVFLRRCLEIDRVRESSVFQDFLDPNTNWSEVLNRPPLSNVPKSILKADPFDPAHSTAAHSYLPLPSTSNVYVKETEDDKKFKAVEENAKEYESIISTGVEKTNKRHVRHLAGLGHEYSEAGAVFNGFSLEEGGSLASTLEKIGQVHDNCYLATETSVKNLNYEFTEPLGESAQFASVLKEIIKFRQQKSMQLDITARSLKHKLNYLRLLEKAELENKRIEEALQAGESKTGKINFDRKVAQEQEQKKLQAEMEAATQAEGLSPLEPKKVSAFKIPGMSRISNIFKETLEDPDAQREANMQKTKEDINQLKQTYIAAEKDLARVTEAVSGELERFHATKNEDLKKMMQAYASTIVDWARHNLEFWQEAKAAMERDI